MFRKSHERIRTADEKPTMSCRLHLRKPKSLDSVSSHDSISTASTTMPRTPVSPTSTHHRHSRVVEFDPLSLHPTYHAPARLAERPFIHVLDQDEAEYYQPKPQRVVSPKIQEFGSPAEPTPQADHEGANDHHEHPAEHLTLRLDLSERPTLVRSHWSYSTINTMNDEDEVDDTSSSEEEAYDDDDEDDGLYLPIMRHSVVDNDQHAATPTTATTPTVPFGDEAERQALPQPWQNFSYKRNTVSVPRRRPQEDMNSIDHYVKRGCWKRRGIVFLAQDPSDCAMERLSARTVG
jgi:hypothetical protein